MSRFRAVCYIISSEKVLDQLKDAIRSVEDKKRIGILKKPGSQFAFCNYVPTSADNFNFFYSLYLVPENTVVDFSPYHRTMFQYVHVILWDGSMKNYEEWLRSLEPDGLGIYRFLRKVIVLDLTGDFPYDTSNIHYARFTNIEEVHKLIELIDSFTDKPNLFST